MALIHGTTSQRRTSHCTTDVVPPRRGGCTKQAALSAIGGRCLSPIPRNNTPCPQLHAVNILRHRRARRTYTTYPLSCVYWTVLRISSRAANVALAVVLVEVCTPNQKSSDEEGDCCKNTCARTWEGTVQFPPLMGINLHQPPAPTTLRVSLWKLFRHGPRVKK